MSAPACECNGETYPPPMSGMLEQPCVICKPRAWANWNADPYGHLKRDADTRKREARAALDKLTDAERVGVLRHYMGSMKKALASMTREPVPCVEPDCVDGYVHEDGEVSLCSSCGGPS